MINPLRKIGAAGAVLLALSAGPALAEGEIHVHGSSTVAKTLIAPNQAQIEANTGRALALISNGSGMGLLDLAAGKAEVAMISAPIEAEAKIVNEKTPGSLDVSGFQVHAVGTATIHIVVHPGNGLKTLTKDQLRDIFSGKVTNWKEVGGTDTPVVVAAEKPGNGTRAVIEGVLLGGQSITGTARVLPALAQLVTVVGQVPGAIGYGNASSIDGSVKVLDGADVPQPLALVTKGDPSPVAAKLIAEVKAIGSKS
jgi:phosphate transport system substrate-binding protein